MQSHALCGQSRRRKEISLLKSQIRRRTSMNVVIIMRHCIVPAHTEETHSMIEKARYYTGVGGGRWGLGWVGERGGGEEACIEVRHRHDDQFVRLRNDLLGITPLMNQPVQHVMDDCACNAQDDCNRTDKKTQRANCDTSTGWCGVVWGGVEWNGVKWCVCVGGRGEEGRRGGEEGSGGRREGDGKSQTFGVS